MSIGHTQMSYERYAFDRQLWNIRQD
jgi:Skp family chaperone for outer membrane proteins